ncbi:MAG: hypothetical protein V4511_03020 [Bacteroidota bacterium]
MKQDSIYGSGMPFETFMRRALRTSDRSIRKGTCSSIYETLLRIDNGTALVKISYGKQLERVKSCLIKGFDAFLKRKLKPNEEVELRVLRSGINLAHGSFELDFIINQALEVTRPYMDWDKRD